jgi:hypothetical protein
MNNILIFISSMKSAIILFMALMVTTLCDIQASAQSITTDNLTWTVDQLTDLRTGESFSYNAVFITSPGSITWKQQNGSVTASLMVNGVEGSWSNVNGNGFATYNIVMDGISGTLKFARDADGLSIVIDLTPSNPKAAHHRFHVNTVSITQ